MVEGKQLVEIRPDGRDKRITMIDFMQARCPQGACRLHRR